MIPTGAPPVELDMTFTLLVLIPVILAAVYALYRRRIHRPVTKRSLDTFLGLLVPAYFNDESIELIDIDPEEELVVYLPAIGVKTSP